MHSSAQCLKCALELDVRDHAIRSERRSLIVMVGTHGFPSARLPEDRIPLGQSKNCWTDYSRTLIVAGMTGDPRIDREANELNKRYEEQIAMLIARCESYYEGNHFEAISAAAVLYTLLYDKGGSAKSLLGQLNLLNKHLFLDSRHPRHGLVLNTAKGAWPTTTWPEKPWREENLCPFAKWWEEQEFHVHFTDLIFTRRELIELIRHKEGGAHVDPKTHEKIALLRRTQSPWRASVNEKSDGGATMYVGFSLSNEPVPDDAEHQPISDHELGSIIAIAEEVLFSLVPEPENRKRMIVPSLQKPFYLTGEEMEQCRSLLQEDIESLQLLHCEKSWQQDYVDGCIKTIREISESDNFTSEDFDRRGGIAQNLQRFGLPWEPKTQQEQD